MRHDEAQRVPVVRFEWFAVVVRGKQHVVMIEVSQQDICRVSLLGMNKNVPLSAFRWVFRAVAISLFVNLVTGVLLFAGRATLWGTAFPFLLKMIFVVVSAANENCRHTSVLPLTTPPGTAVHCPPSQYCTVKSVSP